MLPYLLRVFGDNHHSRRAPFRTVEIRQHPEIPIGPYIPDIPQNIGIQIEIDERPQILKFGGEQFELGPPAMKTVPEGNRLSRRVPLIGQRNQIFPGMSFNHPSQESDVIL